MLAVRSFGVTEFHSKVNSEHCKTDHGAHTSFAAVVSIAKEHLDMAPESLLSIAANQLPGHAGEVIPLKFWPEPNVPALKVILTTNCQLQNLSRQRRA